MRQRSFFLQAVLRLAIILGLVSALSGCALNHLHKRHMQLRRTVFGPNHYDAGRGEPMYDNAYGYGSPGYRAPAPAPPVY